jgi:alanine dehydrogenase
MPWVGFAAKTGHAVNQRCRYERPLNSTRCEPDLLLVVRDPCTGLEDKMLVGVPREIKKQEARVGLTPAAVREYVARGHEVLVESGAGLGIGADDALYQAAGAKIAASAEEVFAAAEMIVKVKEPQAGEWCQLREHQILFTYLHLAPDPAQTKGLLDSGVTAIAYETVTDAAGGLPLLAPMSEVAGRLSIEAAGTALRSHNGGCGLLLGGVPGVAPARVVVIGGGVVGTQAARMACGLGAEVTVLDRSIPRLRQLDDLFQGRVRTSYSSIAQIEEEIAAADVVIGAVLVAGASAPTLVSRAMLAGMKQGAVLVDVAIDQGGCFEMSRPTTHDEPTFQIDGIIHYCVANMPGSVPRTSSYALNNATLPFGLALADRGFDAIRSDRHLANGLNTHRGVLTSEAVAASLALPFKAPLDALAA